MAQLVDQDGDEDHKHPGNDGVDPRRGAPAEQGRHQQERSTHSHRNAKEAKGDHQMLPIFAPRPPLASRRYPHHMYEDLRSAVSADMPRLKQLLMDLVRLQSVSADGYDPAKVREAGETIVTILEENGFANAQPPTGRRPCSYMPTTTCSPQGRSRSGRPALSNPWRETGAYTDGGPATTRPGSSCISER